MTVVAIADLADLLQPQDVSFQLMFQQELSGIGSGELLAADLGPAQWTADVTSVPMPHAQAYRLLAAVQGFTGSLGAFYLYPHTMAYPQADPTGSVLRDATPKLGSLPDRLHATFTDFPAGYQLTAGDFFQATTSNGRRYLGQVLQNRTADGSGAIASVQVAPPMLNSMASGDPVGVIKPSAKMKIVPGSIRISSVGSLHANLSLSARQTYAPD